MLKVFSDGGNTKIFVEVEIMGIKQQVSLNSYEAEKLYYALDKLYNPNRIQVGAPVKDSKCSH